jgi:hypothetical protein
MAALLSSSLPNPSLLILSQRYLSLLSGDNFKHDLLELPSSCSSGITGWFSYEGEDATSVELSITKYSLSNAE